MHLHLITLKYTPADQRQRDGAEGLCRRRPPLAEGPEVWIKLRYSQAQIDGRAQISVSVAPPKASVGASLAGMGAAPAPAANGTGGGDPAQAERTQRVKAFFQCVAL